MTNHASELHDFADLLRATAQGRTLPAAIIEKDYYLTRALRTLAENHSGEFVLKGGTSLSKGWQLLHRFSEDIDLLLRGDRIATKGAKHNRLKSCAKTIDRDGGFKSAKVVNSETGVHRAVEFAYIGVANDLPGLGQTVLLEAGYRGNASGSVKRNVHSMLTDFAVSRGCADLAADLTPFEIEVQSLSRTFVEKLFAAHAAYMKDFAANGKARHYYDLHELCQCEAVKSFLNTESYRTCVAEVRTFCKETFPTQNVPESDSFAESPAFKPDSSGLEALESNYKADAGLFFAVQPPIKDVLETIGQLLPKL